MALWVCKKCGTAFAVGLRACPQCTSEDVWKENEVPNTTVHGGPSYKPGEEPEGFGVVADESGEESAVETADSDDQGYYDGWSKDELQAELVKRELPKSGNMDELRKRLEDYDAGDAFTKGVYGIPVRRATATEDDEG